jgi:CRISPR/Cas system-associated endonuclease/helicase Cas3
VLDQLGQRFGRVWRDADEEDTDLKTVIRQLLEGEYTNPFQVVVFNTAEGWSRDVSDDIADELRQRCADRGEVPAYLEEFLERHDTGRPMQLPLPILV